MENMSNKKKLIHDNWMINEIQFNVKLKLYVDHDKFVNEWFRYKCNNISHKQSLK